MKIIGYIVLAVGTMLSGPALSAVTADFELGAAWTTRNDQAIPGTDGTRFSLVDDLSTPVLPAFRARIGYAIGERQHVSALFAPLRATCRGTFDHDVNFNGEVFHAGRPVVGIYQFDSYRLTWRYRLIARGNWTLWAGLTGKIRDAEVALVGETESSKTNTGFVPLLNLHAAWNPSGSKAGLLFDADAAAAPQGRAEDVLVAFTYVVRDGLVGRVGYRFLEGGADVDEVYNFALINYLVTGLEARF
jgi:hypothetical protein